MPTDNLNAEAFNARVVTWFSKHGSNLTDHINISRLTPIIVGSNRQSFYITDKFVDTSSGYQNALGYCLIHGRLQCRHFYKSNSESYWREGTGFRTYGNGMWVKGAEKHVDPALTMDGGYIFEGQLHHDFHARLEALENTIKITVADYNLYQAVMACRSTSNRRLYEYFISSISDVVHRDSGLIDAYAHERVKINVLPTLNIAFNPIYLESQVTLQQSVRPKISGTPSEGVAAEVKSDDVLWAAINRCLRHTGPVSYEFRHDALKEGCKVVSYLLGTSIIEIAYTKRAIDMKYKSVNGSVCEVTTPICWVKSVYSGTEVSTFGNYVTYPEDLCFLVQKPMDYIDQATNSLATAHDSTHRNHELIKRMGVTGTGSSQERFRVSTDPLNNIEGSYIKLALYNEKYSPLIRAFKDEHKFPLFKWSSNKFCRQLDIENLLRAYADSNPFNLKYIKDTICFSCNSYLSDVKNHGTDGADRVTRFKNLIETRETYNEINLAIYDLFANNTVNGKSWRFASIRTKDSSYFTAFCNAMRLTLDEFTPFVYAYKNNPAFRPMIDAAYTAKTRRSGSSASNDALARFALKAVMIDAVDKSITEANRQVLLDAIKLYR